MLIRAFQKEVLAEDRSAGAAPTLCLLFVLGVKVEPLASLYTWDTFGSVARKSFGLCILASSFEIPPGNLSRCPYSILTEV